MTPGDVLLSTGIRHPRSGGRLSRPQRLDPMWPNSRPAAYMEVAIRIDLADRVFPIRDDAAFGEAVKENQILALWGDHTMYDPFTEKKTPVSLGRTLVGLRFPTAALLVLSRIANVLSVSITAPTRPVKVTLPISPKLLAV